MPVRGDDDVDARDAVGSRDVLDDPGDHVADRQRARAGGVGAAVDEDSRSAASPETSAGTSRRSRRCTSGRTRRRRRRFGSPGSSRPPDGPVQGLEADAGAAPLSRAGVSPRERRVSAAASAARPSWRSFRRSPSRWALRAELLRREGLRDDVADPPFRGGDRSSSRRGGVAVPRALQRSGRNARRARRGAGRRARRGRRCGTPPARREGRGRGRARARSRRPTRGAPPPTARPDRRRSLAPARTGRRRAPRGRARCRRRFTGKSGIVARPVLPEQRLLGERDDVLAGRCRGRGRPRSSSRAQAARRRPARAR